MRICKDCKCFIGQGDLCAKSRDLVRGNPLTCAEVRANPDMCGPQGAWHEPINEDWREPRDEDGYRKPE